MYDRTPRKSIAGKVKDISAKGAASLNKSSEITTLPIPNSQRRCTDVVFLILLIFGWLAMVLVGLEVMGSNWVKPKLFGEGDPKRLLAGMDYTGTLCGYSEPNVDLPLLWFPNGNGNTANSAGVYVPSVFGVCVEKCPIIGTVVVDPHGTFGAWTSQVDTANIISYCLSSDEKQRMSYSFTIFADFIEAHSAILGVTVILTVTLNLVILFLMRIPLLLRSIVWICALVVLVTAVTAAYTFIQTAKMNESKPENERDSFAEISLMKAVGSVLAFFAVVWLSALCFMRKNIALAISVIKESSVALLSMPLLLLFPIIQTMMFLGFTAIWVLFSLYLITSGKPSMETDPSNNVSYSVYYIPKNVSYAMTVLFFIYFWTVQFIDSFGILVMSYAISLWYFEDESENKSAWSCCRGSVYRVSKALKTTTRYHLGTVAMASFIITAIKTVRLALLYLKRRLSSLTASSGPLMPTQRCRCSPCGYCLQVIAYLLLGAEKCVRYLSKHSFSQTAIFGYSFCVSAKKAFILLKNNFGRFFTLHVIGDFIVLVIKLSVSSVVAAVGYYYISTRLNTKMHGYVIPTVFMFFMSFVMSTMFCSVLTLVTNTIMQCFVVDEKYELSRSKGLGVNLDHIRKKNAMALDDNYDGENADGMRRGSPMSVDDVDLIHSDDSSIDSDDSESDDDNCDSDQHRTHNQPRNQQANRGNNTWGLERVRTSDDDSSIEMSAMHNSTNPFN